MRGCIMRAWGMAAQPALELTLPRSSITPVKRPMPSKSLILSITSYTPAAGPGHRCFCLANVELSGLQCNLDNLI